MPIVASSARVALAGVRLSDTVSAAAAGLSRRLPVRAAKVVTAVSAVNVLLALIASREVHKR